MVRTIVAGSVALIGLLGCVQSPTKLTDPVDIALKTCGMGISTQSAFVFKAAYELAQKTGSVDFSATMSQGIDTQEASVLKQLGDKSPDSTKAIVEEIRNVRECVISQSTLLRPPSRLDLLEQCRLNVQNRISPPGNTSWGTLRLWTQSPDDPEYKYDMPVMHGVFDNGGANSFPVREKCDIRGGKLQDVVDLKPTDV